MQMLNTNERWGAVAKFFHWTIVILIVVQYVLAMTAHDLPLGRQRFEITALHKSMGLTIFTLAVLRLLWRFTNKVPPLPGTLKPYERFLAHATHFGLYALILVMPITGWMYSTASNFPVNWFGLVRLPNLVEADRELAHTLHEVHETLFKVLVGVALLHIAGALKHHFWYKDTVLKRMTPFASVAALAFVLTFAPGPASAATAYAVDPAASKLGFVVTQSEGDVIGQFGKFQASIAFAPEDLPGSRFDVTVDTTSVDTGDDERDTAIKDVDLLDVAKHPAARFVSTSFRHKGGNQYEATGKLTLRGVTRDIRLPFTWQPAQQAGRKAAHLEGETTVNRLDFGVGQGDWKETDLVGNAVKVRYSLTLTPGR
jgi:cytochrome b561/polyisoprenoid-binding protein YceI